MIDLSSRVPGLGTEALAAGLFLAMLLGAGALAADAADRSDTDPTVREAEPAVGVQDVATLAQLMTDHRAIEYRADLVRGTAQDPAVQAARLEGHRAIEYRADVIHGTVVDPWVQAARLARHRAIEYPDDFAEG